VAVVFLFVLLLLMKKHPLKAQQILLRLSAPLPKSIQERIIHGFKSLLDGIIPLKSVSHYIYVTVLTFAIWFLYVAAFYVVFISFNLIETYGLSWLTALVLLVITTISILVPSSPGYVGTYHYLCQYTLGLFSVSSSQSLSFAFLMHGLNFFPIILVGVLLLVVNKIKLSAINS
jgi:uncharacterized membrane protein YbhN (UPF0104 family)